MRFGKSAEEAASEPSGSGVYIRYLKDGDTSMRILQEPDEWVYYWEHFNPGGYSFPCTNERDTCPGCTSDVEKMKKASRKIAFNCKQGEYINVYKISNTLADLLKNRYAKAGTITDRDYTFTRIKSGESYTFDIDGDDRTPVKVDKSELHDIEQLLAEAYEQSWGDPSTAKATKQNAADAAAGNDLKSKLKREADKVVKERDEAQPADPPTKPSSDAKDEGEVEVTEAYLRAMDTQELTSFLIDQGYTPDDIYKMGNSTDEIVASLMQAV